MTHIDDLPVDVWSIIFTNLSVEDLLNCRLVNKKFKNFSDHGVYKLIIGQPDLDDCDNDCDDFYWNYNNKLVEDKEKISLDIFRAIESLELFHLNKNLKCLKIYDVDIVLDEISDLVNLEVLEFGRKYFLSRKYWNGLYGNEFDDGEHESQEINLENLKVFSIRLEEFNEDEHFNLYFELNTPKLEKIQFPDWNYIKLNSDPNSIKHLITINYDNGLKIFKTLEILELRNTYQPLNENVLTIFERLKKLKINLNLDNAKYSDETIKNGLIDILSNRTTLGRTIEIYLEGIKIDNITKFSQEIMDITEESYWRVIFNNYRLLDINLPFLDNLYYHNFGDCIENIKNDLPSTFFGKYFNMNSIYVNGVNDINGLNFVLNNLKYPRALYINCDVSFGQVFFNNLPNTIRVLHVYNNENVDYDFILKLSKLIKFNTNIDKDLFKLVVRSYGSLNYLKFFKFFYKKKSILISKENEGFRFNTRTIDFNQLVVECYRYRST